MIRPSLTLALLLLPLHCAFAGDSGSPQIASQASGGTGMTVYVDPQTGAFVPEPAPGLEAVELSPQLRNALSTSHDGLIETASPLPGGGVRLDLQGRFQSPMVVTIDANGKLRMRHLTERPRVDGAKP